MLVQEIRISKPAGRLEDDTISGYNHTLDHSENSAIASLSRGSACVCALCEVPGRLPRLSLLALEALLLERSRLAQLDALLPLVPENLPVGAGSRMPILSYFASQLSNFASSSVQAKPPK